MKNKKFLQIFIKSIFPILAILTAISEVFIENEWEDKADDIIYLGLAVIALVWAILSNNKIPKFFPLLFLVLALATKVVSLFIEGDDLKSVDPDYAIIVLMSLGILINMGSQFLIRRNSNKRQFVERR